MIAATLRDTVVVMNPAAGSGRSRAVWEALLAREPRLAEVTLVSAGDAATGARQLAAALAAGPRRVIAVGGDGTLHGVANQLLAPAAAAAAHAPPALGLVPAGTGSDFARCLRLPREPEAALHLALTSPGQPLDALRLTHEGGVRWVLNIATLGMGGPVDEAVNALAHRGRTAFVRAAITTYLRFRPVVYRVAIDGEDWLEEPVFVLAVANGSSFGKGMRIAPTADPTDGVAEVVAVRPLPTPLLLLHLPRIFLGAHLGLRRWVRSTRARSVRFAALGPAPSLDVDGEVLVASRGEIDVVPRALTFLR